MAGNTFPIGSIVKVGDQMAIVAGILFDEIDNRLVKSYVIAEYPIGYTGADNLRQIPAKDTELVWEGYRSPAAEPFLKYADGIDMASELADAQTINGYLEEAQKKLFEGEN